MAFTTVTGNAWELIDAWATAMIATGSWVDADPELKADGTTDPAGRVLKYTRPGEEIYVALIHAYIGNSSAHSNFFSAEVVMVFVSTGWNTTSHIPSGTMDTLRLPLASAANWGLPGGTPKSTSMTAQWWISSTADIWAILSVTEPSGVPDSVGLLTFEREAAKEFDDGGSNIFMYCDGYHCRYAYTASSPYNTGWGPKPLYWSLPSAWSGLDIGVRKYLHPFTAHYPNYPMEQANDNFGDGKDRSSTFLAITAKATKSQGNSKVYMAFPIAYADPGTWRSPIKTLKAFFPVESSAGLADGDLISIPVSWNGGVPTTWRYIYKALTSPDGGRIDVAVYYDESV